MTCLISRRVLQVRSRKNKTTADKVTIQTSRNALTHRIKSWRAIQVLYMPYVSTLISQEEASQTEDSPLRGKVELEKLWMPSEVPQASWPAGMASGLVGKEAQLREGEAEEALHQV